MFPRSSHLACVLTAIGIEASPARPIVLSPTWELFDPEGNASLAMESERSFDALIPDIENSVPDPENRGMFLGGNAVRPRVYQIFEDLNMRVVGQAIEVSFDLELLDPLIDDNRGDLHLTLFDTSTNAEMISLIHLGPNPGRTDFMKFRIDGTITPDSAVFDLANITGMGVGGNSRAGEADHPGAPLASPGRVHAFRLRVERVSETELSYMLRWESAGNISIHSFSAYNESTGVIDGEPNPPDVDPGRASDVWPGGQVTQFNGFGFMLHDDDPFNSDGDPGTADSGTLAISKFRVAYHSPIHPPFKIIELILAKDNIVRWEALFGESYSVWTSTDLLVWTELEDGIIANDTTWEWADDISDDEPRRFYRVSWNSGEEK